MVLIRREFMDLSNFDDYKLVLELLYLCEKPYPNPHIVLEYVKEFGVKSDEDKRNLNWANIQLNVLKDHKKDLRRKLKEMPEDVDEVIHKTPELYWPYIVAIKKSSRDKPRDKRKVVYI